MSVRRSLRGALCLTTAMFALAIQASAATWTPLTNLAPSTGGTMLLLTDGTIMVQTNNGFPSANWMLLAPDSTGNYANGTWSNNISPMNLERLYFASIVLPSGKVWVLGGEYTGSQGDESFTNTGEIYDPVANTWTPIANYPNEAGGCFGITINSETGNTTLGSAIVTGIEYTGILQVGWTVAGPGIPDGATISSIDSTTQIHISAAATATGSADGSDLLSFAGTQPGCFGDVPTMLLNNGNILAGDLFHSTTNIYNVATNTWTPAPTKVYPDQSDEEGWVKLPDGTILNYDIFQSVNVNGGVNKGYAELYNGTLWMGKSPDDGSAAGSIPALSSAALGEELGPAIRLLDGRVLVVGATGNTAVYAPSTNTWAAGPTVVGNAGSGPTAFGADDAPAAIMPSGHVIFAADAGPSLGTFTAPTQLFDFNPAGAGTIAPLATPMPASLATDLSNAAAFTSRMLMLPTGQMLYSDGISQQLYVYTPDGAASTAYKPVVNGITYSGSGGVFTLTGKQLNGQSAGSSYGDDVQTDENYPIVRLTNSAGKVFYCKTTNWSNLGVATGTAVETVSFQLNPAITAGSYSVVVTGAGISSSAVGLVVTSAEIPGH